MRITLNLFLFLTLMACHERRPADFHIYNVSKGAIYYKARAGMAEPNTSIYFKDYGRTELIQMDYNLGNIKRINVLQIDGDRYWFSDATQAIKTARKAEFDFDNLVFNSLDKDIVEQDNIQKVGDTIFLNRNCTKYTFSNEQRNLSGYAVVWEGIPLIIQLNNHGKSQRTEAVGIDTVTPISPKLLELPKGIEIVDKGQ